MKHESDGPTLARHCKEKGHNFKIKNVTILDREINKQKNTREMMEISQNKKVVNFKTDVQNIINAYTAIVKEYYDKK